MIVPIDEIRELATRLKVARRDEPVGFTRDEMKLICEFPRTFWGGVAERKDKAAARKATGDPHWPETWIGDNYI